MSNSTNNLKQRILKGVDVRVGGCWFWRKNATDDRPGTISLGDHSRSVHRVCYELFVAPIPEDFCVRQTCGNLWCSNPEHLVAVVWAAAIKKRKREAAACLMATNSVGNEVSALGVKPAAVPVLPVAKPRLLPNAGRRWDRKYRRMSSLF